MSERLARQIWWWVMRFLRHAPVKNFNHKIARHLGPKQAAEFLRRGQQQNAFARRHAVSVIKFSLNLLFMASLMWMSYVASHWLLIHGYFDAPGSPKRAVTSD